MTDTPDLIAALRLLMADMPPAQRLHLFQNAFNADMVTFYIDDAVRIREMLYSAHRHMLGAAQYVNGGDPYSIPVRKAGPEIAMAVMHLKDVTRKLGFTI